MVVRNIVTCAKLIGSFSFKQTRSMKMMFPPFKDWKKYFELRNLGVRSAASTFKYIFQFGQIYFAILTNIFCNLDKYILQFGQIYLAIFRNKLCNLDKFVNVETHFLKKCHLSSCKILDLLQKLYNLLSQSV